MTGINIGGVPEHFNLPWRLAIEEGKMREAGIDLHWADMNGGTGQMVRGLETGSIDVAVLLTEGITRAILQGLKARIVHVYVVSPLNWGIHVPHHSDIKEIGQVENQVFAISREGSGSHLMAYVMADQQDWATDNLKFNVIGDVYGGLWALQHDQAQCFLWEKYTTYPFVEQEKCRSIGTVVTPWPCFAIAVREEVYERIPDLLKQMCEIVFKRAKKLKDSRSTPELISWRYNLRLHHVKEWLQQTDWNYNAIEYPLAFEKTVQYLSKLNLVSADEAKDWREKLF